MTIPLPHLSRPASVLAFALIAVLGLGATTSFGQGKKRNPVSKLYVADIAGEAQIDTGDAVEDLSKSGVYTAQGTVIDTGKPDPGVAADKHYSTMVYSNGTGAFFDADTRVELKKFVQEPFTPNRSDVEVEPSISQTEAFLSRGSVGLCTSKMIAGSSMVYQTPHGSVKIGGRKVVIQAEKDVTKISMLEGESTVRGGPMDMGGHTVHAGEQAIIRPGPPGQPNIVQISKIPEKEMPKLDEKVSMACTAKKTVYFDVRNRSDGDASDGNADGGVTAFDRDGDNVPIREIVPVQVVPSTIPVDLTMSPARRATAASNPAPR
jgi:hypothetical protein